jgi:esterase
MTDQIEPASAFVDLGGLRFRYLDWGTAGAPPLVLLHGFTSNAHGWDAAAPALRDRYRVLALDQRGHGESEWADDYGLDAMVADVEAFRRALRLDRFALLGLSMGGRVAFEYAALHPDAVERLVIVDIGPELARAGLARIQSAVGAPDTFDGPEDAFRRVRPMNPRPSDETLRRRLRHSLIQLSDGRWTWRYDKGFRTGEKTLGRRDPEAAWAMLARIACPTLLVRGAESDLLTREIAERMVRTIPHCEFVEVPAAGHPVPGDNPAGFLEAIREFLLGPRPAASRPAR